MRLDRFDGTGEMTWLDESVVEATVVGFLEALSTKPDIAALPDSVLTCFSAYFLSCTQADLLDLCQTLVSRLNPKLPELPLIRQNLREHVETLYHILRTFFERAQDRV